MLVPVGHLVQEGDSLGCHAAAAELCQHTLLHGSLKGLVVFQQQLGLGYGEQGLRPEVSATVGEFDQVVKGSEGDGLISRTWLDRWCWEAGSEG